MKLPAASLETPFHVLQCLTFFVTFYFTKGYQNNKYQTSLFKGFNIFNFAFEFFQSFAY